jgi:hypothetical protein
MDGFQDPNGAVSQGLAPAMDCLPHVHRAAADGARAGGLPNRDGNILQGVRLLPILVVDGVDGRP